MAAKKATRTGLKRLAKERRTLSDASLLLKKHGYTVAAGDAEFLANLYTIDINEGWREINAREKGTS